MLFIRSRLSSSSSSPRDIIGPTPTLKTKGCIGQVRRSERERGGREYRPNRGLVAHSPSLRGRGGEDASRRVPTAYLFLHLNFIILFRRHGAPEFLVFFFLLTRGRGAPSRRATDHHAPSPPENSEGNNLRNQRRVNSNTIMDNRVFATHNKTALYCAHIVSIYFLPSFLPSAALLRNHCVFFFVYIEHPPSPLYLLLLPRDTRCPRNETQLVERNQAASNDP